MNKFISISQVISHWEILNDYIFFHSKKKLREEQAARLAFERSQREEMERRWQSLKAYIDEESKGARQSEKVSNEQILILHCYNFVLISEPH